MGAVESGGDGRSAGVEAAAQDRGRLTELRFIAAVILLGGGVMLLLQAFTYQAPAKDRITFREVLTDVPPSDPAYRSLRLGPLAGGELVAFADADGDGSFTDRKDPKYRLGPAGLTEDDLSAARAEQLSGAGGGAWFVVVTTDQRGTDRLRSLTSRLAARGAALAVVVDGIVRTAPVVQAPITQGDVEIPASSEHQAVAQAQQIDAAVRSAHRGTSSARLIEGILGGLLGAAGVVVAAVGVRGARHSPAP